MSARQPPDDLFDAILQRTSGSTCDSAHGRLPGFVDDDLDPVDGDLVRSHIDRCTDCASLVAVLARMPVDLPLLAELDPGPGFITAVVDRTARRPATWAARAAGWAAGWEWVLRRPRLAWEGAYLGTILFALIIGSPNDLLARVTRQARQVAGSEPVSGIGASVDASIDQWEGRLQEVGASVAVASREVGDQVARRGNSLYDGAVDFLGTLQDRFSSESENDADVAEGDETNLEGEGENE